MPVTAARVFERVWSFTSQFLVGDDITRSDMDTAFNDVAAGINEALVRTPFATEAEGLLGTVNGQIFWVRDDTSYRKYRNDNGTASLLDTLAVDADLQGRVLGFLTLPDFIAADLSHLPDGTIVKVGFESWIKATGATRFSKADWEPYKFSDLADLQNSLQGPRGLGEPWIVGTSRYDEVSANEDFTTAGGILLKLVGETISAGEFTVTDWVAGNAGGTLPETVIAKGYATVGDGGRAKWAKVVSEPTHEAKRLFSDGTNTAWYELMGWDFAIRPEMLGAPKDGVTNDAPEKDASAKRAVQLGLTWITQGQYKVLSTITPGGRLVWLSNDTNWDCAGANPTDFTEVFELETGSPTPVLSGKYVVLDTKGMERSQHLGYLHIRGTIPQRSTLAANAAIKNNLVAVTSSQGISPRYSLDRFRVSAMHHSMWQGDQDGDLAGGAIRNLAYTGVLINYFEEFMCGPILNGISGNAFDDVLVKSWLRKRGFGRTIIRVGGLLVGNFANFGKNESGVFPNSHDAEAETMTTTAGSVTMQLSAPNDHIVAGVPLAVRGAYVNKAWAAAVEANPSKATSTDPFESDSIWYLGRVLDKDIDGVTLTMDRPAERSVVGAEIIGDPPEFLVATSNCKIGKLYGENIHASVMTLLDRATFEGEFRLSIGAISGFYGSGAHIATMTSAAAILTLHNRALNNPWVKNIVGVGSAITEGANPTYSGANVEIFGCLRRSDWTKSSPIGVVKLVDADVRDGFIEASEDDNPNLRLKASYSGTEITHQRGGIGSDAFALGEDGIVEYLELATIGDAFGASGTVTGPTGGLVTKSAGGDGNIEMTCPASERCSLTVGFQSWTSGAPTLVALDSNDDVIDIVQLRRIITRTGARRHVFFDSPAGTVKIQVQGFGDAAWVMDEMTLRQVITK